MQWISKMSRLSHGLVYLQENLSWERENSNRGRGCNTAGHHARKSLQEWPTINFLSIFKLNGSEQTRGWMLYLACARCFKFHFDFTVTRENNRLWIITSLKTPKKPDTMGLITSPMMYSCSFPTHLHLNLNLNKPPDSIDKKSGISEISGMEEH